jgi:hypothetical protein
MKRGGCDHIVVGFTTAYATVPFTTEVVNSNPVHHAEYSIQHNVIKFVNDFATGRWFSPGYPVFSTNETGYHDIAEILLKVALSIITLTLIM